MADWNALYLDEVRAHSLAPPLVARNLAILHLAAHDAYLMAAGEADGCYLSEIDPAEEPENAHPKAAALQALKLVSQALSPSSTAKIEALWESAAIEAPEGSLRAGQTIGRQVAKVYLEKRSGDGASRTITYVPSKAPGHWQRTPPRLRPPELPGWALVTPFCLERADQFRPPPPPSLTSEAYAKAVNEVKALGQMRKTETRTEDVTATFWSCFSKTATPVGHWNVILNELCEQQHFPDKDLLKAYAVLNLAMADAAVACWDTKYHYRLWRPIDAVRRADEDGNALTVADATWVSVLEAPPHPEYVSGHSTFAGSGAEVLKRLCQTDHVAFEATSDSVPDERRRYESFTSCAIEMGRSRIYGGIHFSFSDEGGRQLGRRVGTWVWDRFCHRTGTTPQLTVHQL